MSTQRLITQPLLELRLKGTQAQMGAQYGEILAAQGGYENLLEFYPQMAQSLLVSGVPRALRHNALRRVASKVMGWATDTMVKTRLPHYAQRSDAMARAANLSGEMARHLLVMDVFQNSIGTLGRWGALHKAHGTTPPFSKPIPHALGACTSAVVFDQCSKDGELMHARNFDFPGVGIWEKTPTIVYCTPNEGIPYGYIGARGADVPGVTAFNAEGLTLAFHTRFHSEVDFNASGVVDLGHEIIRCARTINEAIEIVSRFNVASTWGIVVTSAKEKNAAVIETTAKKMRVTWARDGRLGNTNHYLHADMKEGELVTNDGWTPYTVDRMKLLSRFFDEAEARGGASLANMQALLGADFEVDDSGGRVEELFEAHQSDIKKARGASRMMGSLIGHVMSVQSVVFKLGSGLLSLSVGEAPTGYGPYLDHSIDWSGDSLRVVDLQKEKLSEINAHYAEGMMLDAYRHFQKGYLLDFQGGSLEHVRSEIEKAGALAFDDPSLQFAQGVLSLEARDAQTAYRFLMVAVAMEKSPYRKAQALLWASRSAQALGKKSEATSLRRELLQIESEYASELKRKAKRDAMQLIPRRQYTDLVLSLSVLDAA